MAEKKTVKVTPIDTHGLRVAKRLIADQVALMKGDRSEYARGYRSAMSDLRAVIDREVAAARQSAANTEEASNG